MIDSILTAGGYSAIMVPQGSALVGIADRAGYPVLTVPAGFGAAEQLDRRRPDRGRLHRHQRTARPSCSPTATRFEQGLKARQAGSGLHGHPACPNPGRLRGAERDQPEHVALRAGSAFYKPYDCNPGELENQLPVSEHRPF